MEIKQDYKNNHKGISQYILGIMGIFITLSLIFIGTYLYIAYHRDLSSFERIQQAELKVVQEKIGVNVDNLKKLSVLTSKRIAASRGNVQRIQNILSSSHSLLPEAEFLKFQRITYKKFSYPSHFITRFGPLPLESKTTSVESPQENNPLISFDQNRVSSKTWVFDHDGHLDGILEMEMSPSCFKNTLSIGPTLSFTPDSIYAPLQKAPLPLYGRLPESFWEYGIKNKGHYCAFLLFMLFSLFAISLSAYYLRLLIKKGCQEEVDDLKNTLAEAQKREQQTKEDLFTHEQQAQTHLVTCGAYKKFQTNFHRHQGEQVHHILRSLDVVIRSFKNPQESPPVSELVEILGSCISVAERISNSVPSIMKQESIQITRVLEEVRALFTEKIYKSNLTLEMSCPEDIIYEGDRLFIGIFLINIIGKTLYMIPKNGKVEIKATDQKEGFHIQVKDNGFPFDEKSRNQIKQTLDFFITGDLLQRMRQEAGMSYSYSRTEEGFNVNELFIPISFEESSDSNVIPLFS